MGANLELAMIMRWRGQEVQAGMSQVQQGLKQIGDVGKSTTDRLTEGTSKLVKVNYGLERQYQQTGDTGKSTTDRLIDSTKNVERSTQSLDKACELLLTKVKELGTQRPGDQMASSVRKAREEAEKAVGTFDKLKTAGRLAAGALAGATAAKFVLAEPMNKTMDYGMRLAYMSNTAFSERDLAGRKAGKKELNAAVEQSVREGGGTRDQAATTLDALIAAGTLDAKDSMKALPTIAKASTASGADSTDLANILIKGKATFNIDPKDFKRALSMAMVAGQDGSFELKDMSKWLPQQMAAARLSGMSGMKGFAKLIAANQASILTAGSKDEAGNNVVNLLAKVNSQDTAKDALKLGIDLPGTLSAGRAKGMDSLDTFVALTEKTISKDKKYVDLKEKAKTATGDEKRAIYESQANILEGSAIGKLIQDRQALMALVAIMNNKDYVKKIQDKVMGEDGSAIDQNFASIADETGFKKQQHDQEKEFATYKGFSAFEGPLKAVLDHLIDSSREYPVFTAAMNVATTALTALAAAAGAAGLANILTGGKVAGAASIAAAGKGVATRLMTTGAFAAGMPAASFAAAAPAAAFAGVAAAGAVGYGVGTVINKTMIEGTSFGDSIGRSIAIALAAVGNKEAQESLAAERRFEAMNKNMITEMKKPQQVEVKLTIENGNLVQAVDSAQQRQAIRK